MKRWIVRAPFGDYEIIHAADTAAGTSRDGSRRALRTLLVQAYDPRGELRRVLLEVHDSVRGFGLRFARDVSAAAWSHIAEQLDFAAYSGEISLRALERVYTVPQSHATPLEEPLGPDPEPQDVEFDFAYEDGTPVRGLRYELVAPSQVREKGTLGQDGVLRRKNVAGRYAASIVEIDDVAWERRRVCARKDVAVVAHATGIDDGTNGTVRIYRLHDENAVSAVAELPVTFTQGRAQTSWRYEPGSGAETGVRCFVAEVSTDGGKVWRKSEPLEVELGTIVNVAWSRTDVAADEEVDLVVETLGFPDDAEVAVALLRHRVDADDEALSNLASPVLLRRVSRSTLRCGGGDLPARVGDVYAKVTVKKDGVERTACSPLLWIGAPRAEVA